METLLSYCRQRETIMTTLDINTLALPTSWHMDTVQDVAGPLRLVKWDLRDDPRWCFIIPPARPGWRGWGNSPI